MHRRDMDFKTSGFSESCTALRTFVVAFSLMHNRYMFSEISNVSESCTTLRTFVVALSLMNGCDMGLERFSSKSVITLTTFQFFPNKFHTLLVPTSLNRHHPCPLIFLCLFQRAVKFWLWSRDYYSKRWWNSCHWLGPWPGHWREPPQSLSWGK